MKIESSVIKKLAFDAGFDDCGISKSIVSSEHIEKFNKWLGKGYNAGMTYLNRNSDLRNSPSLLFENTKTVISVILNYYSSEKLNDSDISISKYAYGADYHYVIKSRLNRLIDSLRAYDERVMARSFTDSAPLFERFFAHESGLGFIGKNTCLITKEFGSWVFLGEILTNIETDYDSPDIKSCGNCKICIESCPTGALSESGLNANKCISYHTIENRGEIPVSISEEIETQIFGCDICQDVCPYNKRPVENHTRELQILPQIKSLNADELKTLSNSQFKKKFGNSSLYRAGKKKLISNLKIVGK